MPFWERRYIRKGLSQTSDNQTYMELLPRSGILSAALVKMTFTNGATGGGAQDVIDVVSKIEVIGNGSDVIFSLSGIEASKWGALWTKDRLAQLRDDRANAVPFCMFMVPFGRFVGDEQCWLDLGAYNTVELKITYAHTAGATLFVTGSAVIDIIGVFYARGMTPPLRRGWIRTTQVRNFTSVASGEDVTILSQRYPMLDMMVYAFKAATAEGGVVSAAELRLNGGTYIPFTGNWVDIQEKNENDFDFQLIESFARLATSGDTTEMRTGRIYDGDTELILPAAISAGYPIYSFGSIAGSQITHSGVMVAGTALAGTVDATKRNQFLRARGLGLGHAILIPFMRDMDLDQALQNAAYDDVRLALTQAAAGGTVRVSTRELVAA